MLWATESDNIFHSIIECTVLEGTNTNPWISSPGPSQDTEGYRRGISPEAENLTTFLKSNAPGAKHTMAASQQQNASEFFLPSFTCPAFQAKFLEILWWSAPESAEISWIMKLDYLEISIKS